MILAVVFCASAQSLLRRAGLSGLSRPSRPEPLEPLLPFAEAIEKAKNGDPQGCYALAIHYAKGEEIDRDTEKARLFLKEAAAADYGNAVLVDTICLEQSSDEEDEEGVVVGRHGLWPSVTGYTGNSFVYSFGRYEKHSLTNSADVAAIRAGYERAFRLGVSAATNELARFEQRLEAANAEAKRRSDEARQKIDNAALAKSVLNIPTENMELQREREEQRAQLKAISAELRKARSRQSDVKAPATNGAAPETFTIWEAGGTNGVSLFGGFRIGLCLQSSANEPPYSGWVSITVDKNGRIIKIEGRKNNASPSPVSR